jgi:uncharacterized protein with PIN domain
VIAADTSSIVAALTGEPEHARVNEALAGSAVSLMSAATYLEGACSRPDTVTTASTTSGMRRHDAERR